MGGSVDPNLFHKFIIDDVAHIEAYQDAVEYSRGVERNESILPSRIQVGQHRIVRRPGQPDAAMLLMKRVSSGENSGWLCENVSTGEHEHILERYVSDTKLNEMEVLAWASK